MKNRPVSRPIAVTIAVIFFASAAIYYWRMVEEGISTRSMFSAVVFTIAGILWVAAQFKVRR